MALTAAHIAPLVALIAGILILIMPNLLNYIVAIYLIVVGEKFQPFPRRRRRWIIVKRH